MRIIAGSCRGRRLATLGKGDAGAHLRPTTDRVRESLFNVLTGGRFGEVLEGAQVLDLFAGTGALGLEALSRGAARAVFVDDGARAQRLVAQNIALCDMTARARLIRRDARRLPPNDGAPHDLVFLDPPYGKALGEAALAHCLATGWIAPDALIVWEENVAITPPEGVTLLDSRRYGATTISLLRAAPA